MPRVLIAGCGYVGAVAAARLAERDWQVEAWTRSSESAGKLAAEGFRALALDISDAGQVDQCKSEFDAVIHCASTRGGNADLYRQVYLEGVRNLLARFSQSSLLFVSSTSVYAQSGGEWVTEESAAEPTHPTGKILREAEQLALAHNGIVARLAGIYGPGRSHLLKTFLAGEAAVDSGNDRFVNQIHREDAASALAFLLDRQAPRGQTFNVVDDEPILRSECYRWLAAKLNRAQSAAGATAPQRKRGSSNKRVSNAKLRSLGWRPQYPTFADGMERSVLPSFGL